MDDESAIPVLRPGETIGPFEIVIPRGLLFWLEFRAKTTRRERLRLRMHLMGKARRGELFERFRPWFDANGWDHPSPG